MIFLDAADFGKFVNELRKEQGWTQAQLADRLHVTDKAVSRWETGKNYPDIETIGQLALTFGVSISELLEGKHIEKEQLASVSETQVVQQIRTNKQSRKKYRILLVVVLLLFVLAGSIALRESGLLSGVKYRKIACYSNDILTILNNAEGYITQCPKAEGDFIINHGWVFTEHDKTTRDILYLSGTTENGRAFYVNTLYDETEPENSYCFIGEFLQEQQPATGVYMKDFKSILSRLDLSALPAYEKYEVYIGQELDDGLHNLQKNDHQKNILKFLYKDGVLQKYEEKEIEGAYNMLVVTGFNNGSGNIIAYILCAL